MNISKSLILIGGSDSSGFAGIQTDMEVCRAFQLEPKSVVTTITAQSSQECFESFPVEGRAISSQLKAIQRDPIPTAAKIGLIPNLEALESMLTDLANNVATVFDPVWRSSSDRLLVEDGVIEKAAKDLFPRVTVLTPNILEAELLLQRSLDDKKSIENGARDLLALGCKSIVIKGGHSSDNDIQSYFLSDEEGFWFTSTRKPYGFLFAGNESLR